MLQSHRFLRTATLGLAVLAAVGLRGSEGPTRAGNDFGTCADDLDGLKRAASDASDSASAVASALDDLASKRSTMDFDCSALGDQDLCHSAKEDYNDAKDDVDSKEQTFQSDYDTVTQRSKTAADDCETAAHTENIPGIAPNHQAGCRLIRRIATLNRQVGRPMPSVDSCTQLGLSPQECAICLVVR